MTTFDLDAAIAAVMDDARREQAEQEKEQEREIQTKQAEFQTKKQEEITRFSAALRASLPAYLWDTLGITVDHDFAMGGSFATFTIDGRTWYIRGSLALSSAEAAHWSIRSPQSPRLEAEGRTLGDKILRAIGEAREYAQEQAQRKAKQDRIAAEQQAEHERCKARLNAAIEETRANLWRWPEGRELTMYHWRWCTAPAAGEETAEYDDGWSYMDRLSEDGYVRILEPFSGETARMLRLDMLTHLPVVRRWDFTSFAPLPWEMTEQVTTRVEGIVWDEGRLREDPLGAYTDFSDTRIPRAWLRDLLTR